MDIEREREAFEATQNPIVFERIVYIEKANLFTMKDDFRDDLFTVNKCNELNFGWSSWQAAKAQAVPDGFVLVPKEPSADLVNHGHQVFLGHFNEGGQTGGRSLYFAYKAMIEAQEQAND